MSLDELAARATPWLAPIPGSSPAGQAARLEPAYEAVASEIAKLDAPAGGAVDWGAVARRAGELLQTKTKDLVLASYLARALQATGGLAGLGTGAALLTGLIERYWDSMQPDVKRVRGRANALHWFVEKSTAALQAAPEASGPALEAAEAATRRLVEAARARLADATPAFGPLLDGLHRLKEASLPPGPPPAPLGPGPADEVAAPPPAPPVPEAVGAADPVELLSRIGDALVEVAVRLRAAAPADAAAYRVLRAGLWLYLSAPPPARSGAVTGVPPLPEALRSRLGLLAGNGRWAELLDEAESALPSHRLALDLQHASWQALRGLGGAYDRARGAVVVEVRALLGRMPELVGLSFADGTPFAAPPTRAWIEATVLARAERPAVPAAEASPAGAAATAAQEGARLLADGDVPGGLARMQQAVTGAASGRERFLLRLVLARSCSAAGLTAIAKAAYQELESEVRAHGLEAWEPELAVEALKGLVAASRALGKDARGENADLARLHDRLCSLDPVAAHEVWP